MASGTAYENPLVARYSSEEMQRLFSPLVKFSTWRRLWVALAEAQMELGLPVTRAQVGELKKNTDRIDLAKAAKLERELRHDVMAHVRLYASDCPKAAPIIHLGATSAYVTDNTDIILMREALSLVLSRMVGVLRAGAKKARETRNVPILNYTHLQPAQPGTFGKRVCLWLQDTVMDFRDCERIRGELLLRGVKGTTGTQASFLRLFGGNRRKVRRLEKLVAKKMRFAGCHAVTGQTYPRKVDYRVLSALAGIGQTAYRFSHDMRYMQSVREAEEPFGRKQVGSSAMAYKRNPMRSERIASLSRLLMALAPVAGQTAAAQFLERTLDDSACRRIVIPEAFMAAEAILILQQNVLEGMVVHEKVIARRLDQELPFMLTENILMEAVTRGGDRQSLHEEIRSLSMKALERTREGDGRNDLLDRIAAAPAFRMTREEIGSLGSGLTGRAAEQVTEFLREQVDPILRRHRRTKPSASLRV